MKKSGTTRCHERELLQYLSWAQKLFAFCLLCGSRSLYDLLCAGCLGNWSETRAGNLWMDPSDSSGWRHARPGRQSHWEQAPAHLHGTLWWDGVEDPSWVSLRKDTLQQLCSLWRLKAKTAESTGVADSPGQASIQVPEWMPADLVWQLDHRNFECRVDNQLLANRMSGAAVCSNSRYRARVAAAIQFL